MMSSGLIRVVYSLDPDEMPHVVVEENGGTVWVGVYQNKAHLPKHLTIFAPCDSWRMRTRFWALAKFGRAIQRAVRRGTSNA